MTEEQKKKCEEIYLHFSIISIVPMPFSYKDALIKSVISLAKVFNRDITEEEAEKIIDNNIDKNIMNSVISSIPILRNQSYKDIFCKIANYFDEEQKKKIEEIINSCEEKYKKSLEELLDNFHEGYVPAALLFHYGNMDTIFYYYNPIGMLFGGFIPLSFILSQMEGVENEFFEFLGDSKDKTAEIIIDATVSLSEIFNKNMTKEEIEKLLFIKNDIEKVKSEGGMPPACLGKFCGFTEEFRKIIEEYKEDKYGIERVISAIANYFDNGNKEVNKTNNNKNKINNVVENTAKEKIMSNNNDELTLNLLILGQTGVGKSSLVNALVGREVETTSIGKSETPPERKNEAGEIERGIYPHHHEIDGKKVVIYDSWGLEVDKAIEWEGIIEEELKKRSADKDIKDWFHSVTYCIQAGGHKIQDFDIKMIKLFMDKKYNVIVALTKADQIGEEKEKEFIEIIKKETGINMVIPISANPQKLRGMTEAPPSFGLPEYKAAILVSWKKIFVDRIPIQIVEKLKKDIENAKYYAPNYKPKDDDGLKKLAKDIQDYFNNVLNEKLKSHIKENFEKYNKITEDIITINTNIDISNLYSRKSIDPDTYIYDLIGFNLVYIFEHIKDLFKYLYNRINTQENIDKFINETYKETKKYISEKKFEEEIRKIIRNALNEIDKK